MRIQNKSVSVRSVIFSRTFSLVYFLIIVFFIYKSYHLYPIWSGHYQKNLDVKQTYYEKENLVKDLQERKEDSQTDIAKLRYEKEFFNKLDEGEEMIILFQGAKNAEMTSNQNLKVDEEKERHMFFWEKWYLNVLVWWKNL